MLNDAETQEAARIQARLQAKLQALEANTDLTLRGRDRQRARALIEAQNATRALRERSDARNQEAFARAYRDAFGLDQMRSAEDRALRAELASAAAAGELGPVEAQQRMQGALAIGDSLVARALTQIAFEHRNDELGADAWVAVAEMYGGSAPAVDKVLSAVFDASAEPSKLDRFRDKVATEIAIPPDLQRGSLAAIASDDDGPASMPGAAFGP